MDAIHSSTKSGGNRLQRFGEILQNRQKLKH